jgi:plasmid stability protein
MSSLLIRDVDETLRSQLKVRARANHRSLAEEVRETLRTAIARDAGVAPKTDIVALFTQHFGPGNGVELDLPLRSVTPDRPPPDFSAAEYDR